MLGASVLQWVRCQTCIQDVIDLTPGWGIAVQLLQASCSQLCTPVTKNYNLVPFNRQWRSATGKVTVGLTLH